MSTTDRSAALAGENAIDDVDIHSWSSSLPPGIDYTLSACKGQWSYMNDEGARYIFKGYRIGLNFSQCLRSMFQLHNETVNVWSHLIGSFLFIALCFHVLGSPTFEASYLVQRAFGRRPITAWNEEGSICFANSSLRNTQALELFAWSESSVHFDSAKAVLSRMKMKMPNLEKWREAIVSQASSMRESVEHEAMFLRSSISDTALKVDRSLEIIRAEMSTIGSASLEGCLVCWAEVIRKLTRTRQTLLEQVDGLMHAANASSYDPNEHSRWGISSSEMANFTAAEILSLAATLNTGIAAAKQALIHASQNLQEEIIHELKILDIFPNDMFRKEWESPLERWPIIAFLISAFFCLFLSASYHLFNCHSRFLNDILLLLDYSGISILIAGSSIPPVFYGFYCDRPLGNFYLVVIMVLSVLSFLIGIYSGLNPSSFWRVTRVLAYSANACFSIVPCWHMFLRWSAGEPMWGLCFPYITFMLGLYALGTVIYTLQFPERYFPHRFDIYLSSHQLWHLLVFSAAFLHFFCAVGHFQWRTMHPCAA